MNEKEWEEVYREKTVREVSPPADLLLNNSHLLKGGTALDIAMGTGHNGLFLASRGYTVTGFDRSASAVALANENARLNNIPFSSVEADALDYPLGEDCFDVVLNFYFLERELFPKIKKALKTGGILFFETYTLGQLQYGGPKNPDFLLKQNELLDSFLELFIIFYFERLEGPPGQEKALASLIAQKI